jgi:hypothetical protein
MSEDMAAFARRLLEFYDSCSEPEQQILSSLLSVGQAVDAADVEGFARSSPSLFGQLAPSNATTAPTQVQRESLMTSVLTNIANMKHEQLKGIAQNLRG